MNVIYPYLRNYSHELEWSIKSLKNMKHGDVYVIGSAPDYAIDAKVIRPEMPSWARMSPYNDVLNKHLVASRMDISEEIIFMQDDIFLLEKWDGTIYDRGDLSDRIDSRKFDTYTQMLKTTCDWLVKNGYSTKDYTTHTPMVYNRKKLEELILRILPSVQYGGTMSIRTLYGNVYDVPSEKMSIDTKNPEDYHGRAILSTTEQSFNSDIGLYIRATLNGNVIEKPVKPTVSVIMPTYNDADLVIKALDSIPRNVDEIIIVNDGSTDNTLELVRAWAKKDKRAKVYSNRKNKGVGFTINRCYDLATSDYTVILSSDDYMHPTMKDVIKKIDGSDMVFFNLSYNIKGKMRRPTPSNYKSWAGSCKLVRREFMDGVRASNKLVNEDLELFQQLISKPHTTQFTDIMGKHYNTPRLGSLTDRKQKGEFGEHLVTVGSEAHWKRFNQENNRV